MVSLDPLQTRLFVSVDHDLYIPQFETGKRFFDLVIVSFVIVCLLSWLLPIIGLAIRLTSKGPVFFIQPRTGQNGEVFHCFKFRTMTHQLPTTPFRQATRNDARITRVGAFLRKTNLDELPQVFNVLLGDMSLVGPRPHAVQHDALYWYQLDNYARRYDVQPGITGLAQAMGCRGETTQLIQMKHRVDYDLFYIRHKSAWLDAKICWWTLVKMIQGDKNAW